MGLGSLDGQSDELNVNMFVGEDGVLIASLLPAHGPGGHVRAER